MEKTKKSINWITILFLIISPLAALGGLAWWIAGGYFNIWTVVLTLVLGLATGLGITAGYHRLFSHRSYEAPWPVRLMMLLLGGACFEGSAWEWCLDHRRHHKHIDGEEDPYNIKRGFWHAHILWLFFRDPSDQGRLRAQDLWRDHLIRFQHRFYLPLAIGISFLLPWGLASLWGDPVGGFFVAGVLRLVLNQHFTFAINSVCHKFGRQTYSDRHSARDNWLTALFTYGEGYHNFHHEFPGDYRNGIRFYHWDPTKWLINILAWLRLARNLNVVQAEKIYLKKLSLKEKRLSEKLSDQPGAFAEFAAELLESTRAQVQTAAMRLKELRQHYQSLKRQRDVWLKKQLSSTRAQIRQAEREFRQTVALCESMVHRLNKLITVSTESAAVPAN